MKERLNNLTTCNVIEGIIATRMRNIRREESFLNQKLIKLPFGHLLAVWQVGSLTFNYRVKQGFFVKKLNNRLSYINEIKNFKANFSRISGLKDKKYLYNDISGINRLMGFNP